MVSLLEMYEKIELSKIYYNLTGYVLQTQRKCDFNNFQHYVNKATENDLYPAEEENIENNINILEECYQDAIKIKENIHLSSYDNKPIYIDKCNALFDYVYTHDKNINSKIMRLKRNTYEKAPV